MIMAKLQALYRTQKVLTDSEMVAAQQLMQLSDEDNSNSINRKNKNKNKNKLDHDKDKDEEFDRNSQDEITSTKKIEEIFGKEEEFIIERRRKKRMRSLESIYKATKPIKIRQGKSHHEKR
ncbi:hypothetical protein P3X46_018385 [Hevea brasiliensis]|uniref:Uncharacterized protein n=2 Tax=Hevea brasiliensis TaxID=3981 RepID=A0ABQ9LSJ3_HEVBR|nr:hypothetical protein P3X46_018385 [Hevea brasiliensis]